MSAQTCEEINRWLPQYVTPNIMGGEISVLDNYPELLTALAKNRLKIRIVTNGLGIDADPETFVKTINTIKQTQLTRITVMISTDKWHDDPGHSAVEFMKEHDILIDRLEYGNIGLEGIVPLGRAYDNRDKIGTMTQDPACLTHCGMIIIENGMICLCPFGYFPWKHFTKTTWDEAQEHILEWRARRIEEGMNCHLCMESVEISHKSDVHTMVEVSA